VKIVRRDFDSRHNHIAWQMGIQSILQFSQAMTPIEVKGCHLPAGMRTGIGAPCQENTPTLPADLP
jgi:hypothetical protein